MISRKIAIAGLGALVSPLFLSDARASEEYPNYTITYPVEITNSDLSLYPYEPEYEDMISEARHVSLEILEGAYTIEDDVTIPTNVVPEPAYLGLLGASYLALRRRR